MEHEEIRSAVSMVNQATQNSSAYELIDWFRYKRPRTFYNLCRTELSRHIDMEDDEEWFNQCCATQYGLDAHYKIAKRSRLRLAGNYNNNGSSSSSSHSSPTDSSETLLVLHGLIQHLSAHPPNSLPEGIFRVCGNVRKQRELRSQLLGGGRGSNNSNNNDIDLHSHSLVDIACLLKSLLSEELPLPDSLVNLLYTIYACYPQCDVSTDYPVVDVHDSLSRAKQLRSYRISLLLLSPALRELLRALFTCLHGISQCAHNTKMTAHNLAICFHSVLMPRHNPLLFPSSYQQQMNTTIITGAGAAGGGGGPSGGLCLRNHKQLHSLKVEHEHFHGLMEDFIRLGDLLFDIPITFLCNVRVNVQCLLHQTTQRSVNESDSCGTTTPCHRSYDGDTIEEDDDDNDMPIHLVNRVCRPADEVESDEITQKSVEELCKVIRHLPDSTPRKRKFLKRLDAMYSSGATPSMWNLTRTDEICTPPNSPSSLLHQKKMGASVEMLPGSDRGGIISSGMSSVLSSFACHKRSLLTRQQPARLPKAFRNLFTRSRTRATRSLWPDDAEDIPNENEFPSIRCISYEIRQSQRKTYSPLLALATPIVSLPSSHYHPAPPPPLPTLLTSTGASFLRGSESVESFFPKLKKVSTTAAGELVKP